MTTTDGGRIMTTAPDAPDLRQAAIDAALNGLYDARWPDGQPYLHLASKHARQLTEAAVTAAFAAVAEGLYIADRGDGEPAVYDETRPPGRQCIISPDSVSDRLWALLAAVIPVRGEG